MSAPRVATFGEVQKTLCKAQQRREQARCRCQPFSKMDVQRRVRGNKTFYHITFLLRPL
jgi:hypothetical protein